LYDGTVANDYVRAMSGIEGASFQRGD
jgi:hypothetical protein